MSTIFKTSVETFAAAVILIPLLLLLEKTYFHNVKKTFVYIIFALYLASIYAVTGLPCITYLRFDPSFNFSPLPGIISDKTNNILNVILFVPLGIFLPILCDKFRSFTRTLMFGLSLTLIIEFLQIFTYRATDINDIITNILGTIIGYFVATVFIKCAPHTFPHEKGSLEIYIVCGVTFAVMFLFQPFVLSLFRNIL